jgi:hypothetical protein
MLRRVLISSICRGRRLYANQSRRGPFAEDAGAGATLSCMNTRRSKPDPLQPVDRTTWVVVKDMLRPLEVRPLAPGTDPCVALEAVRTALAAAGWTVDREPLTWPFFFCECDGERQIVAIEAFDPKVAVSPGLIPYRGAT